MSAAESLYLPGRTSLLHARHAVTDALNALHPAGPTTRDALERIRVAQSYLANAAASLESSDPATADAMDDGRLL